MQYKPIQDVQCPYFWEAMEIYKEAFPSNERQPLTTIKQRIERGQSQLFVGVAKEQVVTMALLWDFKKSAFVLLDYLAVKNNCRGQEFGAQFFQFLVQMTIKNKQY